LVREGQFNQTHYEQVFLMLAQIISSLDMSENRLRVVLITELLVTLTVCYLYSSSPLNLKIRAYADADVNSTLRT